MINLCLLLMFSLALLRPNSVMKPSWLATLAGALSISTWGFLGVSTVHLDALIGGSNWITLVRDVFATLAFWFYREAVARSVERRPFGAPSVDATGIRRVPWQLVGLIVAYVIPFALIPNKGITSKGFVLDRLDHPTVWLFSSIYMAGLLFLSIDALRLIRRPRGLLWFVAVGYTSTAVGCLIELAYLSLTYFGFGGSSFRVSMYSAAGIPFFAGLILIGVAIAWNALRSWGRYRWSLGELLDITTRAKVVTMPAWTRIRAFFAGSPRKVAFRLWVAIQNKVESGEVQLSARDLTKLERIRRRFT